MTSTEHRSAEMFFAELLLPLSRANMRRGIHYLDRGPQRDSYWGAVVSRTGGTERLSIRNADVSALFELLDNYWARHNEEDLRQLLPALAQLRQAQLAGTIENSEPQLPEHAYPMW
jgi:hypothetical protein